MKNSPPADAIKAAKNAGLCYVNDDDPGITRVRAGREFQYRDGHGRRVRDAATLGRIKRLAIPPAWTEVWICPSENGHIQATGRDARRRKQYRYHPDWRATRDENKYERMIAFARALPRIRRRVARDLARPGLGREKVLATMVRLLETTLIRVGNE
jgi:DNA topoisomerase I